MYHSGELVPFDYLDRLFDEIDRREMQ